MQLAGDGHNAASLDALETLATRYLPATLGKGPGGQLRGDRRHRRDPTTSTRCEATCPWSSSSSRCSPSHAACGFRSVAIPVVSIALEPAVGRRGLRADHADFQDGRLQGLLGYTSFGGIIYWVPLLMFVFLFGISMDYHVFILSRIRERWARGSSPPTRSSAGSRQRRRGHKRRADHGGGLLDLRHAPLIDLKILGVGTATAVLIDATVIRGVLLPAALALLGNRAWRLRLRLQRGRISPSQGSARHCTSRTRTLTGTGPRPPRGAPGR